MATHLILLWALVALIGRAHCKCSPATIADDERSIAYACTNGDLSDLDEISSDADWIEFTVSRFHVLPDDAFRRFKHLRRLSFYNCRVDFVGANAFSGLDRLEWLIFHGTKIHAAKAAWFRDLTNLRKLILDRCGLVHIEPDVYRALPRVDLLSMRDNDLDCLSTEDLSRLPMLRTVRIDDNPWLCECRQRLDRYFRSRGIAQEAECARQTRVCRFQCMTPIEFSVLPSARMNQHSYTFNRERALAGANEFQTNAFASLDRLPDKTMWIDISNLRIVQLPKYAFFRFGSSLRSLDMNGCGISSIENGAFAGLHRLQRLSLTGNRFTVLGADWFRDLVSLQQLVLQRNDIERIERTALWHVGDSLRHLDIRDNSLRCVAVEELAELKKLERLDGARNPWLCSCRDSLESFLTQRNIGFDINSGRCYRHENEIAGGSTDRHQQQPVVHNTTVTTGRVHWVSFDDTIRRSNISIGRPPPPPVPSEVSVATPQPPIYTGSCYPEKSKERSHSAYTCRAITSVEELNLIPPTVNAIRVVLSNIRKLPQNTFTRFNGYLTALELVDCGIEEIESHAFANLHNLQRLSLRNNHLVSINADTVHGIYNLRDLDLSHNDVYRITNDVFDRLPYLTKLDISDNDMNCIGVEHMLQRLRHLSSLEVSNNPWTCLCGTKLVEFLDSRGIRYDESSLPLKEDCYAVPVAETTTSHVRPVATTSAPEWSAAIEGTCASTADGNAGTRYRCTNGNSMLLRSIPRDATAIEFHESHLPRLPLGTFSKFANLRELIIRNSGLTTVEPGAFDGLSDLVNLTIQDNPLEMIGSSWFALENLDRLDLRGNSIKYIEPGSFRQLNRLTYLNLEGNDLRCIFTSDLNDMANVYVVEFSGNPLKWRCRVELEQFLEARKIRFIKIESSCEGKKLVRNLLLQNKTDGSFDCPSDCSAAAGIQFYLLPAFVIQLLVTLVR